MNGDDRTSTDTFLLVLLAVLGTLSVLLVLPFLQAVLAGGLLAYLVAPLDDRLSRRLGPTMGALVAMVVTIVVVVVPLLLVLGVAADQAATLLRTVEVPDVAALERIFQGLLGTTLDLSSLAGPLWGAIETGLRGLLGRAAGIIGGIPAFLIGTVVFLFAFFSLLRDGDLLVTWLRTAAPLDPDVADRLIRRTDDLLWAAVVGNVVVAGVQAILTVLGFSVLGFDNLVFWAVATFVLSLLPLIGASIVWIPAVGYLFLVGAVPEAVGLLIYGSIVVSGSDNLVRPLAMQRGAHLDTAVLVLGIFGGVALFGFLGLFVGPVLLGLTKEIVEVVVEGRDRPAASS